MVERLPELAELADLLRPGAGEVDLFRGDRLIDDLCTKIYGGRAFESDGMSERVVQRFTPVVAPQSILPASSTNELESLGNLLQRTTLYSNLTVVVCPYDARFGERISQANSARGTNADLAKILEANATFRALLRQGRCVFLPRSYESKTVFTRTADIRRCNAPMRQRASRLIPLPLNVSLHTQTLERDLFLLHTIKLPYFPADLELIANISKDYTESFAHFTHFLADRIAEIGTTPSADDLARIIADIDDKVAALRIEARKLSSTHILRGIEIAWFTISIVALALPHFGAFKTWAGVLGAASLHDLIKGRFASYEKTLDLTTDPFYVPYILSKKR